MEYSSMNLKKTEVVEINPIMARMMLSNKAVNRTVRKTTVKKYARDMKQGKWVTTHQGIALDSSGAIIDGQHRLMAIIESGMAIKLMISYYDGSEEALRMPFDRNMARSLSDVTGLERSRIGLMSILLRILGIMQASEAEIMDIYSRLGEKTSYLKTFSSHSSGFSIVPIAAGFFIAFLAGCDCSEEYKKLCSLSFETMGQRTLDYYKMIVKLRDIKGHSHAWKKEILVRTYLLATGQDCKKLTKTREDQVIEEIKTILLNYKE
jgi:hydrogenase maturation factor